MHSTELALSTHGAACCGGGVRGADRVENVGEVWCGGFDLARDVLVVVVEDVVRSAALDQVVVLGAAGRQDLQILEFGELDGVLSDACWSGGQRVRLSRVTVWGILQLPPQIKTLRSVLNRGMLREVLEKSASHAVVAARGIVAASTGEIDAGTLNEIVSSASVQSL